MLKVRFKDDIIAPTSDTAKQMSHDLVYTSNQLIVSGPRNCGKTLLMAMWLLRLHCIYEGFQSLIVRSEARTISNTVIPTFKNKLLKYPLNDKRQPFWPYGGINSPSHFAWKNGGTTMFGGMDDSSKILGGEYDLIWYNQCERETSQQAWSDLMGTQSYGRAGNWKDPDGNPRWCIAGDCNPSTPHHFLYQRRDELDWHDFSHKDSPIFWQNGEWTDRGVRTINSLLDAYPPGFSRDRYVYGIWKMAEGAVFPMFNEEVHVKPLGKKPLKKGNEIWRLSFDWGGSAPTAVGLFYERDGIHYLFKEIYKSGATVAAIIEEVKMLISDLDIHIRESIVDHNTEHFLQLQEAGLKPVLADKDVLAGIECFKNALVGERLVINESSLIARDPAFPNAPQGLAEEITSYAYKPQDKWTGTDRDEIPIKENDHSVDMCRYYLKRVESSENFIPDYDLVDVPTKKRRLY